MFALHPKVEWFLGFALSRLAPDNYLSTMAGKTAAKRASMRHAAKLNGLCVDKDRKRLCDALIEILEDVEKTRVRALRRAKIRSIRGARR